jgi:hypothetical protein
MSGRADKAERAGGPGGRLGAAEQAGERAGGRAPGGAGGRSPRC